MADEKLNTGPGEEKLPEAPAPVTVDEPQAPAPEQTAAPTPQQEGPAQPEPGDVVVSFDKINELMNEKRQTARAEVEKEEAAKEPEEKTQEEPPAAGDDEPKKARRGRPPKEEKAEPTVKEAAKPRKGRPPKADKAAPGEATPTKRDKLSRSGKKAAEVKAAPEPEKAPPENAAPAPEQAPPEPAAPPRPVEEGKLVYLKLSEMHPFHTFRPYPFKVRDDAKMQETVASIPHISSEPALLGGLLVMSVIRSLGAGIQTPAVNAVIPQLVPEDQLMRYNGINATMQSIVNFAAPAAAGAVFAISTLRTTLMIDIVTAILGTGLLSCLALPKHNTSIEKASVFSDMKIGVKYAFTDKLIGNLLIIYGLFTFFCVPAGYLAGLLVRRVFGDTYWYLTAVEVVGFAGMMAGGVVMSIWGGFKSRGKTLSVGLLAFGSFAIGMGLSQNFILYLGLMVFYGVALTMVQTAITTMLQEKTDTSMQGRVFGLLGTMYSGFLPIGMAIFGPLADILPLQWIMIGSGIALIIISSVTYFNRELKAI